MNLNMSPKPFCLMCNILVEVFVLPMVCASIKEHDVYSKGFQFAFTGA